MALFSFERRVRDDGPAQLPREDHFNFSGQLNVLWLYRWQLSPLFIEQISTNPKTVVIDPFASFLTPWGQILKGRLQHSQSLKDIVILFSAKYFTPEAQFSRFLLLAYPSQVLGKQVDFLPWQAIPRPFEFLYLCLEVS